MQLKSVNVIILSLNMILLFLMMKGNAFLKKPMPNLTGSGQKLKRSIKQMSTAREAVF